MVLKIRNKSLLLNKHLTGANLTGSNSRYGRSEYDYYATNPLAVQKLLDCYTFHGNSFLEPCVGGGHIIKEVLKKYSFENVVAMDIVDRGYDGTVVSDFLGYSFDTNFDSIITNPPYSLALDFVKKCLDVLNDNGQLAMFLKIQFLESSKRKVFFEKYPPRFIYVFSNRMNVWKEGIPVNPITKKPWSTTMCNAWFIWEKGYYNEPIVRWL